MAAHKLIVGFHFMCHSPTSVIGKIGNLVQVARGPVRLQLFGELYVLARLWPFIVSSGFWKRKRDQPSDFVLDTGTDTHRMLLAASLPQ